jgi:ligand-binding sensor domain-containing protein
LLLIEPKTRQIVKQLAARNISEHGLSSGVIYSLYQSPKGPLWIGTRNGLIRYDFRQERAQTIPLGSIANNFVNKIVPGLHDTLWLATGGGLIEYDPTSGVLREFHHDPSDPHSLANDSIGALLVDRSGKVWVGGGDISTGGLGVLDPAIGQFQNYHFDPAKPAGIASNFIRDLQEDGHGIVWLATANGISQAIVAADGSISFRNYDSHNGLGSDNVLSIGVDGLGKLWLSTVAGLSYFDQTKMQFSNHYLTDGDYAAGKAGVSSKLLHRDGTLYFANSNGLGIVQPERIRNNQIPPSVAITDISVLNRSLADDFKNADVNLDGSVTEPKALTLSRQTSMFSLRFSALHYADPKHNR